MMWNLLVENQLNLFPIPGNDSIVILDNYKERELIVWADSLAARQSWRLAARLSIVYSIPQFDNGSLTVSTHFTRIYLNQYSIIPIHTLTLYSIRLQIPYWFDNLRIKIWGNSQVSGETIRFDNILFFPVGSAVYLSDDNSYQLADCRYEHTSRVVGLVLQQTPGTILTDGILYASIEQWVEIADDSTGLNPGYVYFLGENGTITHNPPLEEGNYLVRIGTAQSTQSIEISIEPPILL